jgi:hypothetical protein
MKDAKIHMTTYENFTCGYMRVYVVPYENDSLETRQTAITGTLQTASQPNITSVGTLGSLDVIGMANAATFSSTTLTGTLSTASQPNITSVGTLGRWKEKLE